jgi:hypothetical protein
MSRQHPPAPIKHTTNTFTPIPPIPLPSLLSEPASNSFPKKAAPPAPIDREAERQDRPEHAHHQSIKISGPHPRIPSVRRRSLLRAADRSPPPDGTVGPSIFPRSAAAANAAAANARVDVVDGRDER